MHTTKFHSRQFLIFTFVSITSFLIITSSMASTHPIGYKDDIHPIFTEQNDVIFELSTNSSEITRGEDNLFLFFRFSYENGSYIHNATIKFNITSPMDERVYNSSISVNTTDTFSIKIDWINFVGYAEGNYTILAQANSTMTQTYFANTSFHLYILPSGRLRMYFPDRETKPVVLERNGDNKVEYRLTNYGGATVTNVTILPTVEKKGTEGYVQITIPQLNISLKDGDTFVGEIKLRSETALYQKRTFFLSYSNIDDPGFNVLIQSDPLQLICQPRLNISRDDFPEEITMNDIYRVNFYMTNYEGKTLRIIFNTITTHINFTDFHITGESTPVSMGYNQITLSGKPIQPGENIPIIIEINIEWTTVEGNLWYYPIFDTVDTDLTILSVEEALNMYNENFITILLMSTMVLGVVYFSRDIIEVITKRKDGQEKTIIEETYHLDTVVLDGSNIAWEEKDTSNKPKITNIELMINKLSKANFKKIITVADAALRYQIDDRKRIDHLVKEGAIKMLPARVDGDKFVLRIAEEENAMIVSNDLFKEFREIAPWIGERRIPYTILDGDVYLHPTSASTGYEEE